MKRAGIILFSLVVSIGLAVAAAPRGEQERESKGARVDRKLAEELLHARDNDMKRVIVTMKPGTKEKLRGALGAKRARLRHDFSLIEGFAGDLPAGLVRALLKNQDVLMISTDEAVTSFAVAPSVGTIYTVTNTNNSGAGSLRQAITDANARAGADTIWFNIGSGAKTITVTSGLPDITGPTVMDATSQPGFAGTPLIRVDGNSTDGQSGLVLTSTSDGSVIRGLIVTRFDNDGMRIQSGADNITIAGNWIGTVGTATTGTGNSDDGIELAGSGAVIGGTGPYDRNVITNSGDDGISIVGSGVTSHVISGNYIGLDPDGSTGGGNADVGLAISSGTGNTIGGTTAAARNVISKNYEGIEINTSNNVVQGNYVGTDAAGTLNRGNRSDDGIELQGSATGNVVGGTAVGAGNVIAYNALDGVNVVNGSGHVVLGNTIFGNTGSGIDLGSNGVLANDTSDSDTGANNGQNYPVVTKVFTTGTQVEVAGTLNSTANSYYRVEFFSNASADGLGYGEGQVFLGAMNVATNSSGTATYRATFTADVASGAILSATATKSNNTFTTFSDTSEFAANRTASLVPQNVLASRSVRGTLGLDSLVSTTPLITRTGAGVTVAVIDSGMLLDGGSASRLKTTRDFTTGNPNPAHIAATDGYGHGTHVAGLIGASQSEILGVAPGVSYVSLRVLDNYGVGATSNVIAAVQWAVANKATYGIDILNLSLGHPIYEHLMTFNIQFRQNT